MDIQFEVDSLDSVADESLKSVYVERDGKFHFDPDKYAESKIQSSGLKKKNSDLIAKEKALRESLKKFEGLADFEDDDLAEFQTWRENKDKTPPPDNKSKSAEEIQANFDKVYKKAEAKWNEEKTALTTENEGLKKENKHFKLTVPLRQMALEAGVNPQYLELVMMETGKRFDLNEAGKIVFLDEDGDPTDIKPERFFSELYKVDRAVFYLPSGAAGSGAPSNTAQSGNKRVMRRSEYDKLLLSNPASAQAFLKDVSAGKASLVD